MRTFLVILIVSTAWVGGFLAFANRVAESTPPPDPPQADAIVALTGGSTIRLEAAEALLEEGLGRRLLISGVNREATRKQVRATLVAGERTTAGGAFDCCVDLGFQAENTLGNAQETAPWVARHHYQSLIVVTADYHMPRALLELHAAMPGVVLYPFPVATEAVDARRWWASADQARRLGVEYCKYVVILIRNTLRSLAPQRRPGGRPLPAPANALGPAS
jgi:uncharacterized SAM-binding protein YcdF (DUF218 family)